MLKPRTSRYRVKKGDSLWKIARTQYGNPTVWPEISKANRLPNDDLILVGMVLHLPPVHAHRHDHHTLSRATTKGGATAPKPAGGGALSAVLVDPSQVMSLGPPVKGVAHVPVGPSPSILRQRGSASPRYVLFPAVSYKFDDVAAIVIPGPVFTATLRLIGEVSMKQKGTMPEVELSQRGTLTGKLKAQYDSKFADLIGQVKVGYNSQTHLAQVSFNLTTAAKFDGQVISITKSEYIPPNRFKFTYQPTPIEGEWKDLQFKGNIGIELEIMVNKPGGPPSAEPMPRRSAWRTTWVYVAAGALVVAGSAIIVADVAKDVGTLGTGLLESPLSYAAASALFSKAAMMAH